MKWRVVIGVTVVLLAVTACGVEQQVLAPGESPGTASQADSKSTIPYILDGSLTLQAFDRDRTVMPDTDQNFEFTMINHTDADLPVVVVLERESGQRWDTSLCVQDQCILGDGSGASVSDPVVLPPYLQQPFQAHVFIAADARSGQAETLKLRVEPQVDGIEPRSLTLSAAVAAP